MAKSSWLVNPDDSHDHDSDHMRYLPHAFSITVAARKFLEADSQRWFAPSVERSTAIVTSDKDPLRKVLVPIYGIRATTSNISYTATYDVPYTVSSIDSKGNTTYNTYYTSYSTRGVLSAQSFSDQKRADMVIYAGDEFYAETVESAVGGLNYQEADFQTFTRQTAPPDVVLDKLSMTEEKSKSVAANRVANAVYALIRSDVRWRHGSAEHVSVTWTNYSVDGKTFLTLRPMYALKLPGQPLRALAAYNQECSKVYGPAATSDAKVMLVTAMTAFGIGMLLFSPSANEDRLYLLLAVAVITAVSGVISNTQLDILNDSQKGSIEKARKNNREHEPRPYELRLMSLTSHTQQLLKDSCPFETLGLSKSGTYSEEEVKKAYHDSMRKFHNKDHKVSLKVKDAYEEIMQQLAESKEQFLNQENLKRREASTEILYSEYHKNFGLIADYLCVDNTDKVMELIEAAQYTHLDYHDEIGKTLLAAAVERANVAAVLYALDTLKCSVNMTNATVQYNTALHFAAALNHQAADQICLYLLGRGAEVNLVNIEHKTPLDMVKRPQVKNILLQFGARKTGVGMFCQRVNFFRNTIDPERFKKERQKILLEGQQDSVSQCTVS